MLSVITGDDWTEWEHTTARHPRARAWHRATVIALLGALAGGAMLGIGIYFFPLVLLPGVALAALGLLALPVTIAGTARASGRTRRQAAGESARLSFKTLRDIVCGL